MPVKGLDFSAKPLDYALMKKRSITLHDHGYWLGDVHRIFSLVSDLLNELSASKKGKARLQFFKEAAAALEAAAHHANKVANPIFPNRKTKQKRTPFDDLQIRAASYVPGGECLKYPAKRVRVRICR